MSGTSAGAKKGWLSRKRGGGGVTGKNYKKRGFSTSTAKALKQYDRDLKKVYRPGTGMIGGGGGGGLPPIRGGN